MVKVSLEPLLSLWGYAKVLGNGVVLGVKYHVGVTNLDRGRLCCLRVRLYGVMYSVEHTLTSACCSTVRLTVSAMNCVGFSD